MSKPHIRVSWPLLAVFWGTGLVACGGVDAQPSKPSTVDNGTSLPVAGTPTGRGLPQASGGENTSETGAAQPGGTVISPTNEAPDAGTLPLGTDAGEEPDAQGSETAPAPTNPGTNPNGQGTAPAGVVVLAEPDLRTSEQGARANFQVALARRPCGDVRLAVTSSNPLEAQVNPSALTFTTLNWSTPQWVTVIGLDDSVRDGDVAFSIDIRVVETADPAYVGLSAPPVPVVDADDESAGIIVLPSPLGMTTTESGGQATFSVQLQSQPTAPVTIPLDSSDSAEGMVTPTVIAFTALDWNIPKVVTVLGMDDAKADGNRSYAILFSPAISSDPEYQGLVAPAVQLSNTDNDTPGITANGAKDLRTTESGGLVTFTIVLDSQPAADVTIGLSSNNTGEGNVSPATMTFSASSWNTPQTVTVTGVDDFVQDGNRGYDIVATPAVSNDAGYSGKVMRAVPLTNMDDDRAGITVHAPEGLYTTEGGGQAMFTVALDTQPTATVTIGLSSSNSAEGTVSPTSLVFTETTWNAPQTVTVTGVDDSVVDGDTSYTIVTVPIESSDPVYRSVESRSVHMISIDDDTPGGGTVCVGSELIDGDFSTNTAWSYDNGAAYQPADGATTAGYADLGSSVGTVSQAFCRNTEQNALRFAFWGWIVSASVNGFEVMPEQWTGKIFEWSAEQVCLGEGATTALTLGGWSLYDDARIDDIAEVTSADCPPAGTILNHSFDEGGSHWLAPYGVSFSDGNAIMTGAHCGLGKATAWASIPTNYRHPAIRVRWHGGLNGDQVAFSLGVLGHSTNLRSSSFLDADSTEQRVCIGDSQGLAVTVTLQGATSGVCEHADGTLYVEQVDLLDDPTCP